MTAVTSLVNGQCHRNAEVSEDEFAAGFSLSSSKARAQEEVSGSYDCVSVLHALLVGIL